MKKMIKIIVAVVVFVAFLGVTSAWEQQYTLDATVVYNELDTDGRTTIVSVVDTRGERYSFDTKDFTKYHKGDSVKVTYSRNHTDSNITDDTIVGVELVNCIHHYMGVNCCRS